MQLDTVRQGEEKHLSRLAFFAMVTTEFVRKGALTQDENLMLGRLTRLLRLDPVHTRAVTRFSVRLAHGDRLAPAADVTALYARVLRRALAFGDPTPRTQRMLEILRTLMGIPAAVHERLRAPVTDEVRRTQDEASRRSIVEWSRELARQGQLDVVEELLSAWIGSRGDSGGLQRVYAAAVHACLEVADQVEDHARVIGVAALARRLAELSPQRPDRWAVFGDVLARVAARLAAAGRWDLHAAQVAQFADIPGPRSDEVAMLQARTFATAAVTNLRQGRIDEAFRWHGALGQLELTSSGDLVRCVKAEALASTILTLSTGEVSVQARLTQACRSLARLLRAHPEDGTIVKAVTDCAEAWVKSLMRRRDLAALGEFLRDIQGFAGELSGDHPACRSLIVSLVAAITWWKAECERTREGGPLARWLARWFAGPDPILDEVCKATRAIMVAHPLPDRLAHVRRRFEGLTGEASRPVPVVM